MRFIDEAYLKYKKNTYKPDRLGIEWLKIDSKDYNRMLYEYGELHVSMDQFALVRDHVRMLWGSVLNWLDTQPPQKATELSNIVLKTVDKMEREDKYDISLSAFSLSLYHGKIGETYNRDDGSYCYEALMAYKVFYWILYEIIREYEIPETKRDMPLYPEYDDWVSERIFAEEYEEAELLDLIMGDKADTVDKKIPDENSMLLIEELDNTAIANEPKYEAFRAKVTSCCEVCRSLDDICRTERAIKKSAK